MTGESKTAVARGFVHSLNILLKFARLYEFGHARTSSQFETTWNELRTALKVSGESGLLLGASGTQLHIDGVPLESAAAEKSFARMLSNAGIASIHFSSTCTQASLARFVRAFPTGGATSSAKALVDQLRAALEGDTGIKINEVRFVREDAANAGHKIIATLTSKALGGGEGQFQDWLNDPQKLLQLIIAAEGSRGRAGSGSGGPGGGSGGGSGGEGGTGGSGGSGSGTGGGWAGTGGGHGGGTSGGTGGSGGTGAPGWGGGPGGGSGSGGSGGSESGTGGGWVGPGTGKSGSTGGGASTEGGWGGPEGGSGSSGPGGDKSGGPVVPGGGWGGPGFGAQTGSGESGATGTGGGGWGSGSGGGGGGKAGSGNWSSGGPGGTGGQGGPGGSGGGSGGGQGGGSGVGGEGGQGGGATEKPHEVRGGGLKPKVLRPTMWGTAAAVGLNIGSPGGQGGPAGGGGSEAVGGRGAGAGSFGSLGPDEHEIRGILGLLSQLGQSTQAGEGAPAAAFQQRLSTLPARSQYTLHKALAGLAAQAPTEKADQPMLLKLAEHVAIRFALDSYERGEVRVDAVREMLDSMGKEITGLRKVLGAHEQKLSGAGVDYQSHADQLAQQFWAEVPPEAKRTTLMSKEAWCIPPGNARLFVEELFENGDAKSANEILLHYASCITLESQDARRATAIGLSELADLYSRGDAELLPGAIRVVGAHLCVEEAPELQTLIGASFVRLVQQAGMQRVYPAMLQALQSLESVEQQRPAFGPTLRPRIGIEERLPEFIEEALRAESIPPGLAELMSRMPVLAADQLSSRFSRSGFRDDCDLLIQAVSLLGETGLSHLRQMLKDGDPAQAVDTVGLLSRLDIHVLQEWLPSRMKDWKGTYHDRVVRQLAAGASPARSLLLLGLFEMLDPLVKPLALDEMGMSGDLTAIPFLRSLVENDAREGAPAYLRLKAIEALGRLSAGEIVPTLRKIVETRQMFRWSYPTELRIVAAQVLGKLDPEWKRSTLGKTGLDAAEMAMALPDTEPMSHCIRQRRYPRLKLSQGVAVVTTNLRDNYRFDVQVLNLGGGVATCERYLTPGTLLSLKFSPGLRPLRAQAFVRDARSQNMGFEFVEMELEDRYRLRKLLVELGGSPVPASAKSRSRRRGRAPAAVAKRGKSGPTKPESVN